MTELTTNVCPSFVVDNFWRCRKIHYKRQAGGRRKPGDTRGRKYRREKELRVRRRKNAERGATTATGNANGRESEFGDGEISLHAARCSRPVARVPGVAVYCGRVLTTGGFEAASSRLPAAPAAYSPDLLGRGRLDGAIFPPFFFCQPASSGLSGRGAESCGGSPLEAGSRKTRPRGWGCRPVFLGLKGRG